MGMTKETWKTLCGIRVGDMKDPDPDKRGLVGFVDLPAQEVGPEDVKIKVAYCAICGSDPHTVGGAFGQPMGSTDPIPLGHEISGIIVELGEKATTKGLKVGDRVGGNFLHFCGKRWTPRNRRESDSDLLIIILNCGCRLECMKEMTHSFRNKSIMMKFRRFLGNSTLQFGDGTE